MGRLVEFFFQWIYLYFKLSLFYIGLSLAGGIIFGLAPASSTLVGLYAEHRHDFKAYTWGQAWSLFKSNIGSANYMFYSLVIWESSLLYGLFLLVQFRPSFFTVILTIFNSFLLLFAPAMYMVYLKLQAHFECNYNNSLKLSLIGTFTKLSITIKLLFGSFLLLVLARFAPAMGVFLLVGIWHAFINDSLEPIYGALRERLVRDETAE